MLEADKIKNKSARGQWNPEELEEEIAFWPSAFWIDPGVVTGCCVVWFDPIVLLDQQNGSMLKSVLAWSAWMESGGENHQVRQLVKTIADIGGEHLQVGVESFVPRRLDQSKAFLSPVRIRAALEFAAWSGIKGWDGVRRNMSVVSQTPADAKNVVTDGRLREWNFWTPGPDHARDATRHALLYLRKLRAAGSSLLQTNHGSDPDWAEFSTRGRNRDVDSED